MKSIAIPSSLALLACMLLPPGAQADEGLSMESTAAAWEAGWEACLIVETESQCDDSAADGRRWYRDADQDGLGDSDCVVRAPEQPCGYVRNRDDLDDTLSDL